MLSSVLINKLIELEFSLVLNASARIDVPRSGLLKLASLVAPRYLGTRTTGTEELASFIIIRCAH